MSLMPTALHGLLRGRGRVADRDDLSGGFGGRRSHMRELVEQMKVLGDATGDLLADPASSILKIDRRVMWRCRATRFPPKQFGVPRPPV